MHLFRKIHFLFDGFTKALGLTLLTIFTNQTLHAVNDSAVVMKMIGQANSLFYSKPDKAITVLKFALVKASQNNSSYLLANIYKHFSYYYSDRYQFDSSLYYIKLIETLYIKNTNDQVLQNIFGAKAFMFNKENKIDSMFYYRLRELESYKQTNDSNGICQTMLNISSSYYGLHDYTKMFYYTDEASKIANRLGEIRLIGLSKLQLGNYYFSQEKYYNSMMFYFEGIENFTTINDNQNIADSYSNLASIFNEFKQYDQGIVYLKKSIELNKTLNRKIEVAYNLVGISLCYRKQKKIDEALNNINQAEQVADSSNDIALLKYVYEQKAHLLTETGKFKEAIPYIESAHLLSDSLITIQKLKFINELERKYETEKNRHKIDILEKNKELSDADIKITTRQRNIFLISASALLLISLLIFFIYRQKVINAKILSKKNEKIYQQKLSDMMKNQEIKTINAMLEGQEDERKRIGEELHDRLGSLLSTIKLIFTSLEIQNERFDKTVNMLDEACDEVRRISHNMVSGTLINFGLLPALNDIKEALELSGNLKVIISSFGLDGNRMASSYEINIYRIIQELMTNIVKHANANEVIIEVSKTEELIRIIVSDNGTGFDPKIANHKKGIGIKNMLSRVNKMNGTLHIDSDKSNGSTFIIEIPVV